MKPADGLILVIAIGLISYLYAHFWTTGHRGHQVVVSTPFETMHLSLQQMQQFQVEGKLGPSKMQISQGRIRFLQSPCRQKQCIHSGWLKLSGDFAACLPNGISIAVQGENTKYDAINY